MRAGAAALRSVAGLQVAHSRDFQKKPLMSAFEEADTLVFDELGVAVSDTPPDQVQALSGVESTSGILAVEPERIVYALSGRTSRARRCCPHPGPPALACLGGLDGRLSARLPRGGEPVDRPAAGRARGRRAGADRGTAAGAERGRAHLGSAESRGPGLRAGPDGASGSRCSTLAWTSSTRTSPRRVIQSQIFVAGQAVQDGHGHGTHCIGTAAGRAAPQRAARATASPTAPRSSPARCSATQGSGRGSRHPRRHRVGDRQPLRGRLDVARRPDPDRTSPSRRCSSGSRRARCAPAR